VIGFLAASSLLGALAVAWPIWLHLRRQRRRTVQVVPSLRIFFDRIVRSRRRRLQEVLLLASRAAAVLLLSALVAQPFLETARDLPLPLLGGRREEAMLLGVVVDDGVGSLHGERGAGRLEASRAWLLEQIDRLPEMAAVAIATTTSGRPTGLLARARARSLVERMTAVPREGNAAGALARLADLFGDRRGAIAVTASLDGSLWPEGGPARPLRKVFFHDTSGRRAEPFIRRLARAGDGAGGRWACDLAGDGESLGGKVLRVADASGREVLRRPIGVGEAVAGRAVLEEMPGEGAFEVSLEGAPPHPWRRAYAAAGETGDRRRGGVHVFHDGSGEAVLAARIIDATLRAIEPGLPRTFIALPGRGPIPPARAAVFIGSAPAGGEAAAWLEERLEEGIDVLCLPAGVPGGAGDGAAPPGLRLASWGPPENLLPYQMAPLRLGTSGIPEGRRFEAILLGEMEDLEIAGFREPVLPGGPAPAIVTASGKTLLAVSRVGDRSAIWALGVSLGEGGQAIVFHPAFPIVIDWILFPAARKDREAGEGAVAGETADLEAWFGPGARGDLVGPGGPVAILGRGPASAGWAPVSRAGIHELRGEGGTRRAAANDRRPAPCGAVDRGAWSAARGVAETVWLDDGSFVPAGELAARPAGGGERASSRYDLAAVAAALLIAALAAELALLALCWRRARP